MPSYHAIPFLVESLQAIAGGVWVLVDICVVYASGSLSQSVQLCRTWKCAGLVSSSVCSICCPVSLHWYRIRCPIFELQLPFWSFVLLGTILADNMSIAFRESSVLRFSFMLAWVFVSYSWKSVHLILSLNNGKLALVAAFSFTGSKCFYCLYL